MDDYEPANLANLPTKRQLLAVIDRLALSADTKAILNDLAEITIDIGSRVISAGRQILAFVLDLMKRFPNTAFGVIVALVVSSLIAAIPAFGIVLGPLLAPLLLAFGLTVGALADLKEAGIRARLADIETYFTTAIGKA